MMDNNVNENVRKALERFEQYNLLEERLEYGLNETASSREECANGIKDEFGAIYSPDGKRLLVGANIAHYKIKAGTEVICNLAFHGFTNLASIEIPNSVIKIGNHAFALCQALTSIEIPESVTHIGVCAFRACHSLESVIVPKSVTYLCEGAFYCCEGLRSVTLESVTHIGEMAFQYCSNLMSVNLPKTLTHIGDQAFCLCSCLESIHLPESVTNINYCAFAECSSLSAVNLPSSLFYLGVAPFEGSPIRKITSDSPYFKADENALYEKDCETLVNIKLILLFNDKISHYEIPFPIKYVDSGAFSGCTNLTSIKIPSSVVDINESMFDGCPNLNTIIIPCGSRSSFEHVLPEELHSKLIEQETMEDEQEVIEETKPREIIMNLDIFRYLDNVPSEVVDIHSVIPVIIYYQFSETGDIEWSDLFDISLDEYKQVEEYYKHPDAHFIGGITHSRMSRIQELVDCAVSGSNAFILDIKCPEKLLDYIYKRESRDSVTDGEKEEMVNDLVRLSYGSSSLENEELLTLAREVIEKEVSYARRTNNYILIDLDRAHVSLVDRYSKYLRANSSENNEN